MRTHLKVWSHDLGREKQTLYAFAIGAGIILLLLSWLFPPWTAVLDSLPAHDRIGAGFRYLFGPHEAWSDNRTFVIDWQTLLIIDLGIVLATAGAVMSIKSQVE